ncbi:hypothetical protein [Clostridium sp. DL1XJH146]
MAQSNSVGKKRRKKKSSYKSEDETINNDDIRKHKSKGVISGE